MPSGSRRYHPQAAHRDPLNTLAGTLADPRDQAWCARVKPEVAALLLAQEPASHTLAAGWWPRRTPQALGGSDDQGLGQGLQGCEGRPGSGDWPHADDNNYPSPVPDRQ